MSYLQSVLNISNTWCFDMHQKLLLLLLSQMGFCWLIQPNIFKYKLFKTSQTFLCSLMIAIFQQKDDFCFTAQLYLVA